MSEIYDVVIIGEGPAGLAAGLYASRARLKTLMIEKKRLEDKSYQQLKWLTIQVC